jgi:PAS domain S-box-containing protein
MTEDPEIIKELRTAERLGLLTRGRIYKGKKTNGITDSPQQDGMQQGSNNEIATSTGHGDLSIEILQKRKYNDGVNIGSFITQVGGLVLFLNKDGILLDYFVDDNTTDFFGLSKGAIGTSVKDSLPDSFASRIRQAIDALVDTNTIQQFDVALTYGQKHQWFTVKVSMQGDSNESDGFFVFAQNSTKQRQTEEQLFSSETRFKDLIEQSPVSIQIIDANGKTIQVNPAWEKLWGITLDDLRDYNILQDKQLQKNGINSYIQRAFNGEIISIPPVEYAADETLGKGRSRWVTAIAYPIKDRFGVIKEVTLIHQDITENKAAEKRLDLEQKKLLSIFDGIDEPIYVADTADYELLYMNGPSTRNWGDRVGEKCYRVLQNRDSPCPFCTNNVITREPGKSYIWEFQNTVNDQWYRCIDRLIPWPDGRQVRFEMAIDISEIKKSHNELKDAHEAVNSVNKELQRKVEEKTENINALVKQKDDFIHMLGHDLKNPMTPILTLLPIIENKIDDPKSKDMMKHIIQNTRRMKEIIDETLKLARLDDISRTIEPVDICLPEEIKEIINEHQTLFEKTNFKVDLDVEENCHVFYDKHQFYDLVSNLVNNAVKYTPDDTYGNLRILSECKDDEIILSFKDSGIGLTEEQASQVFDKFYKAGIPREGMNSSGLGLSICKTIVGKHGGRIWVESDGPGRGSTFYVSIQKHIGEV